MTSPMRDGAEHDDDAVDPESDEATLLAWTDALGAHTRIWIDLDVLTAPGEYQARFTLHGAASGLCIAEISAPRELVELLGLGTPVGYHEAPVVAEKRSREEQDRVAELNRGHNHWRGGGPLVPDEPYLLRVPASRLEAGFGHLSIGIGSELDPGGGMAFRYLPIGLADPRAARRTMARWNEDRWGGERAFGPIPPYVSEGEYGQPVRTSPFTGGKLPRKNKPAE